MTKNYKLNAEGKKLGRLASEISLILTGKNTAQFVKNTYPNVLVEVENASKIAIPEKKMGEKEYKYYSGYPGGLRFESLRNAVEKKGIEEVLRKTVYGMLPTNKLRSKMIKNLKITK